MQIIVVHPKLKQAVAINLGTGWLVGGALALALVIALGTGLLSYVTVRHTLQSQWPLLQMLFPVPVIATGEADPREAYLRDNLDALAVRLGQLQARLTRLDALGERVASMAGLKPVDLPKASQPNQGGPLIPSLRPLSLDELAEAVSRTSSSLENRIDTLSIIESELLMRTVTTKLLPTNQPLPDGFAGSRFGVRVDPFTGRSAVHEGIDFNAPAGTTILAAGAGAVVQAGPHPSYGLRVDVDHGNGLVTRYAHASRLMVKAGDIVRQGQKIAEVGSTGRSTGPHLHFEVRVDDEAQDPLKYLQAGLNLRRAAPTAQAVAGNTRR